MIFNSLVFVVFLVVVFTLHWLPLSRSRRHQNIVLLISSYVFYGWWDVRFLALILFSSLVDYYVGRRMAATDDPKVRRIFLIISLSTNLGTLFLFKYLNFFVHSFKSVAGLPFTMSALDIILPVGISFYTFQTLSYSIDIYRRQLEPTRSLLEFLTFVSFFPQLVAGPIERARMLLPQVHMKRTFNYDKAVLGCRLMLIGAFKKIVVADRVAPVVDSIFAAQDSTGGWVNVLGIVLFAIQIYCDFSGYSDIAIGTAKLFGIDLMVNFDRPYFSRDIGEFWRRWHISLSTWFRDYLYIPLGGSRGGKAMVARNVLVVFLVSGLWHGANWTFVVWGALHGLLFLPVILLEKHRKYAAPKHGVSQSPAGRDLLRIAFTFTIVCITWIFFRAADLDQAMQFLGNFFRSGIDTLAELSRILRALEMTFLTLLITSLLVVVLFLIEWFSMDRSWVERFRTRRSIRYTGYGVLIACIAMFGVFTDSRAFIYFQF